MWDEKEFFDNFIKETEQIEPSSEFISKMKKLSNESTVEKQNNIHKFPKRVMGVVAAAAVVGIIFFTGVQDSGSTKKMSFPKEEIHANKEEKSKEIQGSIGEIVDKNLMFLEKALENSEVLVEKENGSELTLEERKNLLKKISDAKEIQISLQEYKQQQTYHIKGEEEMKFSILDEKYLLFEGIETVYLLDMD